MDNIYIKNKFNISEANLEIYYNHMFSISVSIIAKIKSVSVRAYERN